MSRTFEMSAESSNTPERILATFRTEGYWRARILRFDDGNPTIETLSTDADGTTTVRVSLHFGVEQLPPPLNRLPGGSLRVVQTESWQAAESDLLHGTITVDAPGAPVSGHGTLSVTAAPGGSRLTGKGTVDVRVPLIGGAIAGVIATQLATGIRDIHQFTEEWITGIGCP